MFSCGFYEISKNTFFYRTPSNDSFWKGHSLNINFCKIASYDQRLMQQYYLQPILSKSLTIVPKQIKQCTLSMVSINLHWQSHVALCELPIY